MIRYSWASSRSTIRAAALVTIALTVFMWMPHAYAQSAPLKKGTLMTAHATGPFDVKVTPMPPDGKESGVSIARMSLDKRFHGDLEGTSQGQMLTVATDVKGSAGYVAIERVTATLKTSNGPRAGTFALQHTGTMTRGTPQLSITVVPDSGTAQLTGLTGQLTVNISGSEHSYDFEYTLP